MPLNQDNINSLIFLDYIKSYGFDPNNYKYILELVQSAPKSMSQFLKEYKQYLVSSKVNYEELDKIGIDGAFGYLFQNGLLIPKTIANEDRFSKRINYSYPTTQDFDVIIANGTSINLLNTTNFSHDKYIGFCMDSYDENLDSSILSCKMLYDELEKKSSDNYVILHDKMSSKGKELYLVKKR